MAMELLRVMRSVIVVMTTKQCARRWIAVVEQIVLWSSAKNAREFCQYT